MAADARTNRKRNKRVLFFYRLIFFFVILWFVGHGLVNFVMGMLVQTEIVQKSVIEKKLAAEGYLIRDEILVTAPVTGRIINKLSEGERVGIEMPIMEVEAAEGTAMQAGEPYLIKAPISGVVSYVTDGLEEIFRPNELQALNMEKIEKIKVETIDNNDIDMVKKGNRLCKIVNNLEQMQMFLQFPLDAFGEPLQKGQELTLYFPEIEKTVTASILDLKGIGNNAQVLVEFPDTMYKLLNRREQKIELIIDQQEGIFINKKALVEKNTETGIYWLRKGFVFWQPVKILAEDGENVMVEGIESLTEIILNPQLVKEGQHLK
ncbi:MAG: HlyD family efflux transporter periplasmic adaptor subunit [Peptococcaceae bacterium]